MEVSFKLMREVQSDKVRYYPWRLKARSVLSSISEVQSDKIHILEATIPSFKGGREVIFILIISS